MKNITAFYWIGTVGMILTALLHMVMTLLIVQESNHGALWSIYPTFLAFLIIGFRQIYKHQKKYA